MIRSTMRAACAVLALGACGSAALAQAAQGGGSIYTCVDAKGRRLTSDRPIMDCLDREQREIGGGGTVLRRQIGPTLTDNERAAIDERLRREAEARLRVDEEIRRDRALVNRYPSQSLHELERQNALRPVDDAIAAAYQRVGDLENRRNAIGAELEFHRKDPAKTPASLTRQASDNASMLDAQRRFIDDQNKEKLRINARFDTELARLRQLWGSASGSDGAGPLKPASASTAR